MLDAFAAAWNRHDVDGLMACMADDCVFEAAAGPDVAGTRHVGRDAVGRAYAAVFETYKDGRWNNPRHFVAGTRAVSEWTFTGTTKDGQRVEVNGCDVFTLRGTKIVVKNSYRKQRAEVRWVGIGSRVWVLGLGLGRSNGCSSYLLVPILSPTSYPYLLPPTSYSYLTGSIRGGGLGVGRGAAAAVDVAETGG